MFDFWQTLRELVIGITFSKNILIVICHRHINTQLYHLTSILLGENKTGCQW
jgi:hypothetical protein